MAKTPFSFWLLLLAFVTTLVTAEAKWFQRDDNAVDALLDDCSTCRRPPGRPWPPQSPQTITTTMYGPSGTTTTTVVVTPQDTSTETSPTTSNNVRTSTITSTTTSTTTPGPQATATLSSDPPASSSSSIENSSTTDSASTSTSTLSTSTAAPFTSESISTSSSRATSAEATEASGSPSSESNSASQSPSSGTTAQVGTQDQSSQTAGQSFSSVSSSTTSTQASSPSETTTTDQSSTSSTLASPTSIETSQSSVASTSSSSSSPPSVSTTSDSSAPNTSLASPSSSSDTSESIAEPGSSIPTSEVSSTSSSIAGTSSSASTAASGSSQSSAATPTGTQTSSSASSTFASSESTWPNPALSTSESTSTLSTSQLPFTPTSTGSSQISSAQTMSPEASAGPSVFTSIISTSSTVSRSDTTFVTVIVSSTIISRMSSAEGSLPASPPSLSLPSPPGTLTLMTSNTESISDSPLSCDYGVSAWCALSPPTAARSTDYCVCPFCIGNQFLCSAVRPTNTKDCPDGWVCSLTIASDSSTPILSLGPGVTWISTPTPWNTHIQTITALNGRSTTTVPFDASLTTSTVLLPSGLYIEFPWRLWSCIGPLCDPADLFNIICLIPFVCKPPPKPEWPNPKTPVVPPIGPPSLAPETEPKTFTGTPTPTDTASEPSSDPSGSSSDGSSSSSSSSCSVSPVSTCSTICSTVSVSSSASETCSTTCTTVTTCSGTDLNTVTTTGEACSVSQMWNDPAIASTISSWIAQFPFTLETIDLSDLSSFTMTSNVSSAAPPVSTWTTVVTNSIGDLISGVAVSSGSQTSWVTSTIVSTHAVRTPVTLTSESAEGGFVHVLTCHGFQISGMTTCESWEEISTAMSPPKTTSSSAPSRTSPPVTVVTLTSTSSHDGVIDILSCKGEAKGGSSSCTESKWHDVSRINNFADETRKCAAWAPQNSYLSPLPTTNPPRTVGVFTQCGLPNPVGCNAASTLSVVDIAACATPVIGSGTTALPTPWKADDSRFDWFRSPEDQVNAFCQDLVDREVFLYAGEPNGKKSPGECNLFFEDDEDLTDLNYGLTIALAYDKQGCGGKADDDFEEGVNFRCYSKSACVDGFMGLFNACRVRDDTKKDLMLDERDSIGAVGYRDCMRWSIVAIDDDNKPPGTFPPKGPDNPDEPPDSALPCQGEPDDDAKWYLCEGFSPVCETNFIEAELVGRANKRLEYLQQLGQGPRLEPRF